MKKNPKETLKLLSIKEVFTLSGFKNRKRVKFFRKKGTVCVDCGCVGTFFALELDIRGNISLDLYGIDTNGVERLITIDHNIQKSKGGKDGLYNLQTMCRYCNTKKEIKFPQPLTSKKKYVILLVQVG